MRIFVTGATGFIGTEVVRELQAGGHTVVGLSRSDAGAARLGAAGVEVRRGTIEDAAVLRRAAEDADAVIHLAFDHDFSKFAENGEVERKAIAALGDGLVSGGRPLVVTGGTGMVNRAAPVTEYDEAGAVVPRTPDAAGRAVADRGVPVSVVRLPQVHDPYRAGLLSLFVGIAQAQGFVAFVGDGANRWPAAHVSDVARLYRAAVERPVPFARYHAVAEEGVAQRAIAEVLGEGLGLPTRSVTGDEVGRWFGWMADLARRDLAASSVWTRAALDWTPRGPGLLDDLRGFAWVPKG